jgi:hypothetical protein
VLQEVERVANLFPHGVPESIEERNQIISSWPDGGPHEDVLDEVDDVLMPLMPDLEAKLDAFLHGAGLGA